MQNQHNVYIMRCGLFIKIGIAKNLEHRLASIKTSNPHDVELVASFETDSQESSKKIESFVHSQLTAIGLHHRLEWFHLSALDYALEICKKLVVDEIVKSSKDVDEKQQEDFSAPMSIQELRWHLQDRIPKMVTKATGIHYNTIRAIRDNLGGNPTYSTIQKLSAYLRK